MEVHKIWIRCSLIEAVKADLQSANSLLNAEAKSKGRSTRRL